MRLFPVAPLAVRQASEDVQLERYWILKGTMMQVNIHGLHHSPQHWPEPSKYQPERFMDNPELAHSRAYLPFGAGPHNCVGLRFALEEGIIMLAQLYSHYVFRLSKTHHPGGELHLRGRGGLDSPDKGICVTAIPRKQDT
jgi:cytochrome P450